jgi:Antirestriction protein (ArdA)
MENANNITAHNQIQTATHQKICNGSIYARPYNPDATGFYFDGEDEFEDKAEALRDAHGNKVEEFELMYIDGNDSSLFEACGISQASQANLSAWFDKIVDLEDYEKAGLYFLVACQGYNLDTALSKYEEASISKCKLTEAAEQLFDEIYLPEVPEFVRGYIDYQRFARDCEQGGEMTEFEFVGKTWTCTNAACL